MADGLDRAAAIIAWPYWWNLFRGCATGALYAHFAADLALGWWVVGLAVTVAVQFVGDLLLAPTGAPAGSEGESP